MSHLSRHKILAFMVLCLLVAAVLRLPRLPEAPPGLHYDEAANGILAADIGWRGERPIFISSYTGKEVLFFYLAGGLMRLLGDSIFALRLTAAFVGLLTVAATYWLGRELLLDRRIALVAAALLAVSFWHLVFSRLGFRAVTQPLLQAMTVAALFRGLRRQEKRWLLAGGLFLGLTAYTYLAARLFPVVLLLAALPLLLHRRGSRQRWWQLALFGLAALLVLAPLLTYFATHPDAFWVRVSQVGPDTAETTSSLARSYLRTLQMFFLVGDPYWRFNSPGRPLFDWFWGALLVVGWIVSLRRWPRLVLDWQRAALLLLILFPFIMILPSALAVGEIVPSNLRAIGLIPFIFYLPAVGLMTLLEDLAPRLARQLSAPSLTRMALAAGLLTLVVGGVLTGRAYFRLWASQSELYYESDGDLRAVARFLDGVDTDGKTVYVAALHYQHPTLAFLSQRYDEIKWLPQSRALVFPAQGDALYVYPHNSTVPHWAAPYLETADRLESIEAPDGKPAFAAYALSQSPSLSAPNSMTVNFGNTITLLGYETGDAAAGTTLPLTLYWRVEAEPTADFTPFVHLEDSWQHRWSQAETFAYPAAQWQPGEIIIQRVELSVPPGTPPGSYRLRVGLFAGTNGQRLPRLDEDGRYAGDAFVIEDVPVSVGAPPDVLPQPPFVISEQVRPGLRLLGYERGATEVATGDSFGLGLWWQTTSPLPALTTRLDLMRPDNTGRILLSTQPVHDTYPFYNWETPQFLIDRLSPRIPPRFPPGAYRLHLRILDAEDETVFTADLGPLSVEATERLFTPPTVAHPLQATFGNEIELLGYELEPAAAEGQFALTLVWRALRAPAADYTVFVHVLGRDGVCCVWQQDTMPDQGQYPTSRWLAGEVVVDTYQIDLTETDLESGNYPIEIGLYIAETGRRLQVTIPGQETRDAVYLRPLSLDDEQSNN